MDHSFRASSCPTLRRTGSRRCTHALVMPSSGTSQVTHSLWTERTCEPSRTRSAARWPNTSPRSSWKASPTSNVSIWTPPHRCSDNCCSHSRTQQHRTQTARNIELLAGASPIGTRWSSVSFSQKQNVFWRPENCFHKAQPRNLTRQMPGPKPPTPSQRRTCWSHMQMTTAATVTTHPLVSRNQRRQRHQRLPLLHSSKPPS